MEHVTPSHYSNCFVAFNIQPSDVIPSVDLRTKDVHRNTVWTLNTSTHCFHELDILDFLKKEAFWYAVICLKMEENIKRKNWDEICPQNSGNGNGLENLIFLTTREQKNVHTIVTI